MCNHDDDTEFHCKNSMNSFDGHEAHFMSTQEDVDGRGNCSENYSTLERHYKNASELSEESDAWMNIEHRLNFLERRQQRDQDQKHLRTEDDECRSSRNFDEHLDIDDDGLIGYEEARPNSYSTYALDDEHDEQMNNIELISYENNFNLYNSFWWAMGTLIQTTSDLYPKVFFCFSSQTILCDVDKERKCRWLRDSVCLSPTPTSFSLSLGASFVSLNSDPPHN